MPATIRKGNTGSDVSRCQQDLNIHGFICTVDGIFGSGTEAQVKAFQAANGLTPDGIVGPLTWAALEASPEDVDDPTTWDGDEASWNLFVPLLGPAMGATYSLSGAQMPKFPPGVNFLPSKYLGEERTNCSMFTAYFLGNGFKVPFTLNQWNEWQVAKGSNESLYQGYGPWVTCQWNVAEQMPPGAVPRDGVYLVQSFTTWPKGHSWIVLDYDDATGKILTLESNTSGSGLNGVGFGGLGPIRSTNAHDWKNRVKMTWESRTRGYAQVHMSRLAINHQTVRDWIASQ
jgi:peptidoglycan hydrolase-like protein with peptidoglycan-binding domain